MPECLIIYDLETASVYGLSKVDDRIVVCDFRNSELRSLEINTKTHEMSLQEGLNEKPFHHGIR